MPETHGTFVFDSAKLLENNATHCAEIENLIGN